MAQLMTDVSEFIPGYYTNMGFTGTTAQALPPQVLVATGAGNVLDLSEFHVSIQAILIGGTFGANSTSAVIQIEECATTNGTFTVIPAVAGFGVGGNMVFPTLTTSSQGPFPLAGLRTYQYVRANCVTCAGTTPAISAAVIILSMPKSGQGHTGVSNQPAGPTTY